MEPETASAETAQNIFERMIWSLYRLPSISACNHFGIEWLVTRPQMQVLHREFLKNPGERLSFRDGPDGRKVFYEKISDLPIRVDDTEHDLVLICKPFPGIGIGMGMDGRVLPPRCVGT
jgi:hypothetical protein